MGSHHAAEGPPRLLTIAEVSGWLGIPINTLRTWRHRGEGPPAAKIGRHLRFDRRHVESWLQEQSAR